MGGDTHILKRDKLEHISKIASISEETENFIRCIDHVNELSMLNHLNAMITLLQLDNFHNKILLKIALIELYSNSNIKVT